MKIEDKKIMFLSNIVYDNNLNQEGMLPSAVSNADLG